MKINVYSGKHNELLRHATRLVKIAEFINLDGFQKRHARWYQL